MIKARGTTGSGLDLAFLGLSAENVDRLMDGKPILVNLAELGLPAIQVAIVYGQTEGYIVEQLREAGLIDAQTRTEER